MTGRECGLSQCNPKIGAVSFFDYCLLNYICFIACVTIKLKIMPTTSTEIDKYIKGFPESTQQLLQQIRSTISKAAPLAEEKMAYGIPTFFLYGNLVHFAGYQHHIGFYPGADGIANFKEVLSKYKNAKGSVQFPIDSPLPLALVTKIVLFRARQNEEKAIAKKALRKCANGHTFFKSKDCPDCPVCAAAKQANNDFLTGLSAPARRALQNAGIATLKKLAGFTEPEILALHGMGPSSIPKLRQALAAEKLAFKK